MEKETVANGKSRENLMLIWGEKNVILVKHAVINYVIVSMHYSVLG